MTVVTTKPSKIDATALDILRANVGELERAIERLKDSTARSQIRLENLTAERGPLIVPARSGKSPEAQKRMKAIDQELASLKQDVADDEEAAVELEAQLLSARSEISQIEWEIERSGIRALLVKRLNSKKIAKLQQMAIDLVAAATNLDEEDGRLGAEFHSFNQSLGFPGINPDLRSNVLAQILHPILPEECFAFLSRSYRGKDLSFYEQQGISLQLEVLDRLKLVL